MAALGRAGERDSTGGTDCLAGRSQWVATGGGECRYADGALTVRAGEQWATVRLAQPPGSVFDLDVELQWTPRDERGKKGGVEVAVGPHGFGSSGYRVVVSQEPWRAVECRGPKLAPAAWHALELRVRETRVAYSLNGKLVAKSPIAVGAAGELLLRVSPGVEAVVRRCRFRAPVALPIADFRLPLEIANRKSEIETPPGGLRFVYAAAAFGHVGTEVSDAAAEGGRAIEAAAQRARPLIWGQDGSLPADGEYVAVFGLRAIEGSGNVRLDVARSGGGVAASRTVRLEELPSNGYESVAVPFRYEGGGPMEYRVSAEAGRLRIDGVVVTAGRGAEEPGARVGPRRPLPLAEVWKKPQAGRAATGLAVIGLSRRWHEGGWYEFRVEWRQDAEESVGSVGVDMWVACRDAAGIVTVFDYGVACERLARGEHESTAWLDPASCRRCGTPVSLFVHLYRAGVPGAAAWRKWGIPVDDKYIVEAPRVGRLHADAGAR